MVGDYTLMIIGTGNIYFILGKKKTMNKKYAYSHIIYSILLVFLLASCNSVYNNSEPFTTPSNSSNSETIVQVYFTNPQVLSIYGYEGGPDQYLSTAIDNARISIDIAAYDFNLWSLRNALIDATKRGVQVRIVMESDNMDSPEVQELRDAHINIIGDQQEGLMHDKFMIIDREDIWTGSMNFTVGGVYRDDNNLVFVQSTSIAHMYTAEFEQMYLQGLFGITKRSPSLSIPANTEDPDVEVLFSPEDNVEDRIIAIIRDAKSSIDFMLYSFTLDDVGTALIDKYHEGIIVSGVMDRDQAFSNHGTEYQRLKDSGIDVRLDGNENLMHNKVLIIDGSIVITGSYNFSYNAETKNDENVLIIHSADIAAQFMNEYGLIYAQSTP
jgi:phosphatidylserine/phosphatidylglycerophosphate/cardiolipin synthase-like enzyme